MRRVAVLVNRHALLATETRVAWLRDLVGDEDLFAVASHAAGQAALATIVGRGHPAICVGGGDGTFMQVAADLLALAPARLPALYPLRLGTGNAVADVSGAARPTRAGLARDLDRARTAPAHEICPLQLLDLDGRVTHLAGVGLDADWADDYRRVVRQRLFRTAAAPLFRGPLGYLVTAATTTVPRLVLRPARRVRVIALGPASRLDPEGRPSGPPLDDGAVVYQGPAQAVAAATIRSYSRGARFFPFVDELGERFQLRILTSGVARLLLELPWVLLGGRADPRAIVDVAATAIRVELDEPAVHHAGGDVLPATTSFTVRRAPRAIPVFRAPG